MVLLGGYTLVRTAARGRLPHVTSLPTEARELLGPELAIAGTPSVHHAPWVGAAWDYRPGQSVRVVAGRQSFAPNAPGTRLAATPDGDRAGWSVEVGFVMR